MDKLNPLNRFTERSYYSAHFMDLAIWEAYVRQVCLRHKIQYASVSPGLPGTFPTFIVRTGQGDDDYLHPPVVMKFFGPLFDGARCHAIELGISKWLEVEPLPIRSQAILAAGELCSDWQYLVFEFVEGVSIGQVFNQLGEEDFRQLAHQLGETLRCLHSRSADPHLNLPETIKPSGDGFIRFLNTQRERCFTNHQSWNDLPRHLLGEVPGYVLPVEQLVDFSAPPHLIHADLTADHLLGHLQDGRWNTTAIIDWGDAITGNILYELVALVIDVFRGDKHILDVFLQEYDLPTFFQQSFPRKALSMLLLHQFPAPARFYEPHRDVRCLQELAERLFEI